MIDPGMQMENGAGDQAVRMMIDRDGDD